MKITDLKDYNVVSPAPPQAERSVIKDVAIGAAKGAGDTAMSLVKLGRPIQAALDPTKTLQDYKTQNAPVDAKIEDALLSENNAQRTGKVLEFMAEAFFPVTAVSRATGLTGKAYKVAGATFDNVSKKIASISDEAVDGGSKVKDQLVDLITNLDDKTKTALQRTPKDVFQSVLEQGRKAMMDDRNRTPLEAVGDRVAEALRTVSDKAATVGTQKSEMMKIGGISPFKGQGIKQFGQELQSFINSKTLIAEDKPSFEAITSAFKQLGKTPSVGQVDKFIDFAQAKLYAAEKNLTLPASSATVSRLRTLVGKLNADLKKQVGGKYSQLNDEYARLAQITSELNRKLGREAGNAGALVKRLFSPSDARTKELFDELEKLTGQDFFRDARLAKFIMETLGDTRAASLLEQVPRSTGGVIDKVIDYGMSKLTDPLKAAEKYLKP